MARFSRSNLRLRPINRIKHVIDRQAGTTAGTQLNTDVIHAVDNPVQSTADDVAIGCTVNGIFLIVEINATSSAALSNAYLSVMKNPGNNLTIVPSNVVGTNDNKKYVIHQEMVMLQQQDGSNPRTLFKGVIVIPRGYRRFGPDDKLVVSVLSPGVNLNLCIQCHYKEFR